MECPRCSNSDCHFERGGLDAGKKKMKVYFICNSCYLDMSGVLKLEGLEKNKPREEEEAE